MTTLTTPTELSGIPSGSYTLDQSHSRIGFVARHAMVTKVRGAFNDFDASIVVDADDLTRSSARVTIKTASIDTRNEQRDAHLRSNDFLAIDENPEITFVSSEVTPIVSGEDVVLRVTGDLTIKGTTLPVTVDFTYEGTAVDPFGNQRIGFEGSVAINRKDWGVNWNAALEAGGVLVGDKLKVNLFISAVKRTEA